MNEPLTERQAALLFLMREPDPRDLPPRMHRWTVEGEAIERRRARWAYLSAVYVAFRQLEARA